MLIDVNVHGTRMTIIYEEFFHETDTKMGQIVIVSQCTKQISTLLSLYHISLISHSSNRPTKRQLPIRPHAHTSQAASVSSSEKVTLTRVPAHGCQPVLADKCQTYRILLPDWNPKCITQNFPCSANCQAQFDLFGILKLKLQLIFFKCNKCTMVNCYGIMVRSVLRTRYSVVVKISFVKFELTNHDS